MYFTRWIQSNIFFYDKVPQAILLKYKYFVSITLLCFDYFLGVLTTPTFRMFIQRSETQNKKISEIYVLQTSW